MEDFNIENFEDDLKILKSKYPNIVFYCQDLLEECKYDLEDGTFTKEELLKCKDEIEESFAEGIDEFLSDNYQYRLTAVVDDILDIEEEEEEGNW